jgi:hypothetical protein
LIIITSGCTSKEWTLTTSVTPNGSGTVSPNNGTFKNGAEITLVATPAKYYRFNGWAGDISDSSNRVTIKMNSNKNIVASFSKLTYKLLLNAGGSGSGTFNIKSGDYEAGTQVTIIATPISGSRFDRWEGSATGNTNPLSILVDGNKTITANFIKQFKLTITGNPAQGNINPSSGIYDAGKTVEFSATSIFPYVLKNWSGTDNNNSNPTNVTMNSDKSVSANFAQAYPVSPVPVQQSGQVHLVNSVTIFIDLNQNDWLQGDLNVIAGIFSGNMHANIKNPNGTIIKEYGPGQNNFSIFASVPGKYSIFIENPSGLQEGGYSLSYIIYRLK